MGPPEPRVSRPHPLVLGAALLLLLTATGVGLSLWLFAEEAGVAPPVDRTVERAVRSARPASATPPDAPPAPTEPAGAAETCPATLFVETADGAPFTGEILLDGVDQWLPLDAEGAVAWPHRPCETDGFVYSRHWTAEPEPWDAAPHRVPYADADTVTLVVHGKRQAWMRPVDDAGAPIEARIRPGVAQPDGTWLLERRAATAEVRAWVTGEAGGVHTVPLDGAVHDLVVTRDRRVVVTLDCDQCSGAVVCARQLRAEADRCIGDGADWSCRCPATEPGQLFLWTPTLLDWRDTVQHIGTVGADEDDVTIEIRGERGAIEAQVDPRVEAVALRRPGGGDAPQGAFPSLHKPGGGGAIEVDDLLPGDWELLVYVPRAYAPRRVPFTLASGEVRDLGLLAP